MDNVQQLSNFTLDKTETISVIITNVRISRDDSLDIRKRILAITTEGAKKVGINKSTLWYQKKKVSVGKSINIYRKVLAKIT